MIMIIKSNSIQIVLYVSSDFLEKFYPGDEDLLIDGVRGDFGSISIYKRGPISDASLLGRGKGKFSIQYFFKRRRLFVVAGFL